MVIRTGLIAEIDLKYQRFYIERGEEPKFLLLSQDEWANFRREVQKHHIVIRNSSFDVNRYRSMEIGYLDGTCRVEVI